MIFLLLRVGENSGIHDVGHVASMMPDSLRSWPTWGRINTAAVTQLGDAPGSYTPGACTFGDFRKRVMSLVVVSGAKP